MGLEDLEMGWIASCWFCKKEFTKAEHCLKCDLYRCPHCRKCGCDLSDEARDAVIITLTAVKRNLIESHT